VVNFGVPYKSVKNSGLGSLFLVLLLLLGACQQVAEQRQMWVFAGPIMGTDFRIIVVTEGDLDKAVLQNKVAKAMQAINSSMSTYLESSELSQINRSAAGQKNTLSSAMNEVLVESLRLSVLTAGAFDVTVGPIVDLWGFGPSGTINQRPDAKAVQRLADSVGYHTLQLQDNTLIKSHSDTQLDLSAIAKGYAVDRVADTLAEFGVRDYLINIGGELRAAGTNVDRQLWRVGVEKPELLGGIQQVVTLDNMAIATSGDYLNFVVLDGQRFSHTIDPVSKKPVLHRLALVSVMHSSAATADALATALMAMGEDRAIDFATQQKLAAYFVVRDQTGAGSIVMSTEKFAQYSQ